MARFSHSVGRFGQEVELVHGEHAKQEVDVAIGFPPTSRDNDSQSSGAGEGFAASRRALLAGVEPQLRQARPCHPPEGRGR